MAQAQKPKNYVVSTLTADWLDCLVASQSLYSQVFAVVERQYGSDCDTVHAPIHELFNSLQDKMLELMGANIVENIGTISNLNAERTEI